MEVLPGIHLLKGILGSNAYLLEDGDQLAMVDAGLPPKSQKVLDYIHSLGRSPEDLGTIILTHGHPDHTSGVRLLQRSTQARVLVHGGDVKQDAQGRPWVHYTSQPIAREWDALFFQKLYLDELAHEGQVLPIMGGMEVIHTPGHTAGSIMLYLKRRGIIFTGDSLLSNGRVFSRPFPFPGTDFKAYRRSVERIARLDFDIAFPGHGRPLVGGGKDKVKEMLRSYFWASTWGRALRRLSPKARARVLGGAS